MNFSKFGQTLNDELFALVALKHESLDRLGWGPKRRLHFGYFLPSEHYEAKLWKLGKAGIKWLDVGGGKAPFPENASLCRKLSQLSSKLTVIDPSENVLKNPYATEKTQCLLDDFESPDEFDVISLRMVVEHVSSPFTFVSKLARLLAPGGKIVILTVKRWSPVSIVSQIIPSKWHHHVKSFFWGGLEEDTFPTIYKMNTRNELEKLCSTNGLQIEEFLELDDLSVFGKFWLLGYCELYLWKLLKALHIRYPERCILVTITRVESSSLQHNK